MEQDPILITGVGRRLGLALGLTYLQRGIPVIGTYRTPRADLERLRDAGAELHRCDFGDESQIDALIREISVHHQRLRAIIHNASDWSPDDGDPSALMQRMMQVHVLAPYRLNLALAPLLQAAGSEHADIIHIGDYVSGRGSRRHIAYAASKAAQDNLTLSFAAKLAPKVKVNSIAPALIRFRDDDDEAYRAAARDKSLMGREGGDEEFRHAVDYLLASRYVTGRVLPLDGGRHLR